MDEGNWDLSFLPMIGSWVFLIAGFVFAIEFIAQSTRRALNGEDEGYVDD